MLSFKIIELLVPKKTVKVLDIFEHGGHLGHVTEAIFINNIIVLFPKEAPHKI